jgi:predicted MPP superfamily phosphohydrolase
VGRDDRHNHRRESLGELLDRVDSAKPIIILDHQPYNLAEVDAAGVDIQLSGHTHRGQVWPLSLLTDYIYEQSHGYRKWQNTHIYVSSGLSLWGPPFRIGTNSELAIITVKSAAKP